MTVLRIEIHADRVAQPDRIDFTVLAVPIHADDPADAKLAIQFIFLLGGHVVRLAELNIELVIRADPANAGGMIVAFFRFWNQLAFGTTTLATTSGLS